MMSIESQVKTIKIEKRGKQNVISKFRHDQSKLNKGKSKFMLSAQNLEI